MVSRIEINTKICHGKLVIRGNRVLVSDILGVEDSIEDAIEDYPILCATKAYKQSTHCQKLLVLKKPETMVNTLGLSCHGFFCFHLSEK